jgi:hypothetical protein
MRIHFPTVKTTALLLLAGVIFASLVLLPHHASALTTAQKKDCQSQWAGKTFDPSGSKFKNFQDSNCSDSYCGFVLDEAKNTATISCPAHQDTSGGVVCTDATANGCSITDPALTAGGCDGANCTIIDKYINPLIRLLSAAVGIIAVIAIIIGAIQVSTSAGDPQKSASGKNHIRAALIGLLAYVLLLVFINWVVPGGIG